jgi:hypothetical protein
LVTDRPSPSQERQVSERRRSQLVVRRVDPVSVLRVAGLFWLSMFVVVIIAGVLLWSAGDSVGALGRVTKFMQSVGFDDFHLHGKPLLKAALAGGIVLVLLATLLSVLASVLFNLISDVVGGVRVNAVEVAEAPVGERAARNRGSGERRKGSAHNGSDNENDSDGRVSSTRSGL